MIAYDVEDGIGFVRLDRPQARNAMNKDMGAALLEVATTIADDDSLRAVLITGNGPVFSVGGDIGAFADGVADLPDTLTRMALLMHDAIRILVRIDAPIVTAVHGACAGGALGLLYPADITLAAAGTKFATGFGRIGITADSGNTWYLPKFIGIRRAAEMLFEDRVIDADTAADWGLINRVVPAEHLRTEAEAVVRKLAAGATRSYGEMRRLLHNSWTTTVDQALSEETAALRRIARTADAPAAIDSFLGKQSPTFTGK
ncbi:enoyl-CoA hydratase [Nocardia uniformis]|uniref:Enoyl-CoA hydratase n=1 Tax=Nocardia uniformis TaxID=53432 RepID=A0A849CBW6_9NOCA|nr:enoyl-CoA hydratase-related protein [Nocardia uniformis]NNH70461.1 enoyl-CoA hydratase [Nocardia uniformis]